MKYASQVKRTSCVKCAFVTICGAINFTASKEQLHYAARHNFTAACRNITIEIFVSMWYNIGESEVQIALKEANETGYWLELLYKTNYITESEYKALDSACTCIRVMLISSINTAKENAK